MISQEVIISIISLFVAILYNMISGIIKFAKLETKQEIIFKELAQIEQEKVKIWESIGQHAIEFDKLRNSQTKIETRLDYEH